MALIVKRPIVNFEYGRGGNPCSLIVIHCTGKPKNTAEGIYRYFNDSSSERSSHDLILPNGDVWEFVNTKDVSWGAGTISFKGGLPLLPKNAIAREHWKKGGRINQIAHNIETLLTEDEDPTPEQYKALADRVKQIANQWDLPIDSVHVCGHREIRQDKLCPGRISIGKILELANAPIRLNPPPPLITEAPKIQEPAWLQLLKQRVLGAIGYGNPVFGGVPRSTKWNKLRNEFLKIHTLCEACGVKAETVHHILPYNKNPELELTESNLISLCDECHLVLAHLKNFKRHDPEIRAVAKAFRNKIDSWYN